MRNAGALWEVIGTILNNDGALFFYRRSVLPMEKFGAPLFETRFLL